MSIHESDRKKIEKFQNKVNKKVQSAELDFKESRYEEYIIKKYTSIEMRLKFMYEMTFNIPSKSIYSDQIMKKLEEKFHTKIFEKGNEWHKWRITRNSIIHDDDEINQQEATAAKRFFDYLEKKLIEIYDIFKPKYDYHGTALIKQDYDVMIDLEKLLGEPIPVFLSGDLVDHFGFEVKNGFVITLYLIGKEINSHFNSKKIFFDPDEFYISSSQYPYLLDWIWEHRLIKHTPTRYRGAFSVRIKDDGAKHKLGVDYNKALQLRRSVAVTNKMPKFPKKIE